MAAHASTQRGHQRGCRQDGSQVQHWAILFSVKKKNLKCCKKDNV